MKPYALGLLAAAVLAQTSCRARADRQTVVAVRGKVLYRGEPAAGARVAFIPVDERSPQRPQGTVGQDGVFQLSTYELSDGAPAGSYSVAITWPGPNPRSNGAGDDEIEGPDRLSGRYSNPQASAWNVEVGAVPLEIEPFRLE